MRKDIKDDTFKPQGSLIDLLRQGGPDRIDVGPVRNGRQGAVRHPPHVEIACEGLRAEFQQKMDAVVDVVRPPDPQRMARMRADLAREYSERAKRLSCYLFE